MSVGRELVDARPNGEPDSLKDSTEFSSLETIPAAPGTPLERERLTTRLKALVVEAKWPLLCYGSTRLALLVLALLCDVLFGFVHHGTNSLSNELSNWDGRWYVRVATLGYPAHVSHAQTTLGFLPLYSMVMWLVAHVFFCSYVIAGMLISGVGGLIATVQIQRLTTKWWGGDVARKAVLFFCVFPGTIIFSMDYSEGLLIPLIAGCLLALSKRRWVLAGALAGLATGIGPDALVMVPTCAAASFVELRRRGWQDREARKSLAAPILAPFGAAAFSVFLWIWTGTPLASYIAQQDGWHEKTSPLAIPHQFAYLIGEMGFHFAFWHINLNVLIGLLGTVFLIFGLKWLWRDRRTVPLEVLVFTACMAFLVLTSWNVPPNPRMLITAFPVVVIFAKWIRDTSWTRLVWVSAFMMLLMSGLTYVGSVLRP